jgi:signal transduction histidine kinase
MSSPASPLIALAAHLQQRHEAVLRAWRNAVAADPLLTAGASLPRAQLNDHIPALLEDFVARLASDRKEERSLAGREHLADAAAHGLHRWQQGFNLEEVTRELGRLNECVVLELEVCARDSRFDSDTMAQARKVWAELHGTAVSASTSRYFALQQVEAAGHVGELEQALRSLHELENERAKLWQEAAHDLRGNLGVVINVTAGLKQVQGTAEAGRAFLGLLDRNVHALHRLLEDVTSLARLQGGQEHRSVAPFEASRSLREICEGIQPVAQERGLFLKTDGPAECTVEGDEIKIRRIVQNLLVNAAKYTRRGGINVSWGYGATDDANRWFIQVQDSGPGFHAGPGSEMAEALVVATGQSEGLAADAAAGEITHVPDQGLRSPQSLQDDRKVAQQPGEGIGLSIVKRLCELLDATMELESRIDEGTTVRIHLPRRYALL